MRIRLITATALTALALLLNGCGFVTAPIGYGSAYAGKGTIKVADKGIEYGKRAANVVADTAIYVGEAAADGLQPSTPEAKKLGTLKRH